ncbi:hypothetical protein [Rhizorhabdus dicambivorans]|uniref:hypothetical protein n=1 Tax=Rhizorhabdus dicambivorans TaxID=1850238 RepID=UPI000837278E|nr:hypothetical protein [Rhizorhabdus dicambivorans]ATE64993.1 hypothetical protein CMV14_11755 [Rhizorhabdus dicambivorans]
MPPKAAALLSVLFAFASSSTRGQAAGLSVEPSSELFEATDDPINDNDLLLVEVILDRLSITDSLGVYASGQGLYIPVGELSRLLDADLNPQLGERRIIGTIGEARRSILADMAHGIVRVDGTTLLLLPGDMVIGANDIYVRPALLEKLLPVRLRFDEQSLRMELTALEPLPIQSRLDRLKRLRGLQSDGSASREDVYKVRSPPALLSLPSFDVSLEAGAQERTPRYPYRYDVRAGGDLLFSNFQGYVGSDNKGKPATARVLLERRDANGKALGPLGLTRFSAGDIFTPPLALGARSLAGRGVAFSTAPLTQTTSFGRIDLRGELPLGYDVELYVNDVLRSGQSTPVQGRYEFRDVPLTRGINIIRIIAYGPRGERTEDVRVVNVGGGQLEKGQFVVDFGAAQQEKTVIDLSAKESGMITSPGVGDLRVAANIAYGLSEGVTLSGGIATYSPTGLDKRIVATTGVRTSIRGMATQVDVAHDDQGGTAAAVALAGQLGGFSTVVRHSEYRKAFVDETVPRGGDGRALTRSSEIDLDWALRPTERISIPMSMRVSRDQYASGDVSLNGLFRASSALGGVYVSAGFDFERFDPATGGPRNRIAGVFSASSFAAFQWQLRASLDYGLVPKAELRSFALTADRDLSETTALRVGLGQSFQDEKDTTLQLSAIKRLPFADLSLDGQYSRPNHDWRIGIQLAFSLVNNPLGGGYSARRPGAASGGNAAIRAWLDDNGNGRFDTGEEPVAGVVAKGPQGEEIVTDAKGRALVTGLGYNTVAQVQTNLDNVQLDNVAGPPSIVEFNPRAGSVAVINYPIQAKGEVMVTISIRRGERKTGLSAVMLRAVGDNGETHDGLTEYDGSFLFDALRPGRYRLELDQSQAKRLNMRFEAPAEFIIPAQGGPAPDVQAMVRFD